MSASSPGMSLGHGRSTSLSFSRTALTWQRGLQFALGLVWLLDAALQYQPYMFGRAFAQQVIAPTGPGNPAWIARPVHWSAQLTLHHRLVLNAVYATVQLAIAIGIFFRPTIRLALAGSVVWSLLIWWLGEGMGGLFAGPQTPITGSPGAVIIYALIAILVWPRGDNTTEDARSIATSSPLGGVIPRVLWLVLWGGFAFEMVQSANRGAQGLHDIFAGNAAGEPAWLRSIDNGFARAVAHHGMPISVVVAVVLALVALSVFAGPSATKIGAVVAIVFGLVVWFAGEDLGAIATGTATDPNTGPLLVLLAATYWPLHRRVPART